MSTARDALNDAYARFGFSLEHPEVAQAFTAHSVAKSHTLGGPLEGFAHACHAGDLSAKSASEPYAVLFLRWERAFPGEWDRFAQIGGSRWTAKNGILSLFAAHGVGDAHRDDMIQVLLAAIAGPYRSKDWRLGAVALQLDSQPLRERLTAMSLGAEQGSAARAHFLLSRLQDPRLSVGRHAFRRWQSKQAAGDDNRATGP
jgi:hypothetical protein